MLSLFHHPWPIADDVIRGRWHYLGHDRVADEGSFVYTLHGVGLGKEFVDPFVR